MKLTYRMGATVLALSAAAFLAAGPAGAERMNKKAKGGAKASQQEELAIGSAAPMADRKMTDVSGKKLSLKSIAGPTGLLVVFSCNTCPFVLAWEDRYAQLAAQSAQAGVGMVLVNSNEGKRNGDDSLDAMKAHAKDREYAVPYLVDARSELADAFGASRTPHVFLFDRDLKLVYRGAIDDNSENAKKVKEDYVADAIGSLVAGEEVEIKTPRSIGCSIKRK